MRVLCFYVFLCFYVYFCAACEINDYDDDDDNTIRVGAAAPVPGKGVVRSMVRWAENSEISSRRRLSYFLRFAL